MFQLTFVFVGTLAVLASAVTMASSVDHLTRTITAAFAMVVWSYWAISAFSVEAVTNSGVVSEEHIGLTAIGVAASAVMLYVLGKLAFTASVGAREQGRFDPHE